MAVNKVVYNRRTLIDLTADTVSKETLKKGFTAHQADGTMITGEFIGDDYDEIDRILTTGLTDGYKHFSDDGTIISTIDSQGRTLVKTFSNDFLTCTTVLTDPDGVELGRTVKSFSDNRSFRITCLTWKRFLRMLLVRSLPVLQKSFPQTGKISVRP